MSEIIMSVDFAEMLVEANNERERTLLFGPTPMIEPKTENLVFAIIKVAGKQNLCKYDTMSNKAYKLTDTYEKGKEITEYAFVRWARPMDI